MNGDPGAHDLEEGYIPICIYVIGWDQRHWMGLGDLEGKLIDLIRCV
jgi:hypothetical protein